MFMKNVVWCVLLVLIFASSIKAAEDDDFAEFEDDDQSTPDEQIEVTKLDEPTAKRVADSLDEASNQDDFYDDDYEEDEDDDDATVENVEPDENIERDNFAFQDDDQVIETYPGDTGDGGKKRKVSEKTKPKTGLRYADVPAHLRNNWQLYYIEAMFILTVLAYITTYFTGKSKNEEIARIWMAENAVFLKTQFWEVGGATSDTDEPPTLIHLSNNVFTVWCTGRKGVEGVFIEIRLEARHDLITVLRNKFNRKRMGTDDLVIMTTYLDETEDLEPVVLTIGRPRSIAELWRNFADIKTFCPKGFKDKSDILSNTIGCAESQEMFSNIFDQKVKSAFERRPKSGCTLDYIHITDSYRDIYSEIPAEGTEGMMKKSARISVVSMLLDKNKTVYDSSGFVKGAIYMNDRIRRMRLSRDVKLACDKRRTKALEDEQKKSHHNRQENAAAKAEARRRVMNQKIMDEEDPDKARRLKEQLDKKDERKRQKKLQKGKMIKVH